MKIVFSVSLVQLMILILSQYWPYSTSVLFDLYETNMRESFQELLTIRSLKEPYNKFHKTYAKLTVCSLRKAQKSKLCDELAKQPDLSWLELNTDDYENYRCSRIKFQWPIPSPDDASPNEISAAPCPPFSTATDRPYDAQGPCTLLYFVASSAEPRKVLFFERHDLDEPILGRGIAHDIDAVTVLEDEESYSGEEQPEEDVQTITETR